MESLDDEALGFKVLPVLLAEAQKLDHEIRLLKDSKQGKASKLKGKRKAESLRMTQPW